MTTWSKAYVAAAKFVAYTIAWDVFGLAVIFFGFIFAGQAILSPILGVSSSVAGSGSNLATTSELVLGVLIILFGLAIGLIGNVATFFKIQAEFNADEVEGRLETEERIAAK
jgi:hypothetical protein